ncbi:MAG: DUF2784 family protein [Patescibacteria group bacterium]
MSKYKILANSVMVVHMSWVVLMILSIPIAIFYPESGMYLLALPVTMIILWGVYGGCFVTDLERYLRKKYDPNISYSDPFIKHYLKKFFNLDVSAKKINLISYTLAIVLAIVVFTN